MPSFVGVNLERRMTLAEHTDWKEEEKFSPYVGQRNQKGEKHGKGKITWDDGSEFSGQWIENKR